MTARMHLFFAGAASLVVAFAIVWGFVLAGSPMARRMQRLDEQRLQDLQTIAEEIEAMVIETNGKRQLKAPLPSTLEEAVKHARATRINPRDPETGELYRYTLKNETTYELCAMFAAQRQSDYSVFWNHAAGEHCFTINVLDPPPY